MSEEMGGVLTRATRFHWATLTLATGTSVAGNIAHAVLSQPGHALIAALAACVPPTVLCAAVHSVALLVRARTHGATYWSALAMTVVIAGCAFTLSFNALRSLALSWGGYSPAIAWLWPLAIDLSIAQSTLALLALSGAPQRAEGDTSWVTTAHNGAEGVHNGVHLHPLDAPADAPSDWAAQADQLISAGVTRLDRGKVATVLTELADGTAPSTVARRHGVGYATVTRIAETTKQQEVRA